MAKFPKEVTMISPGRTRYTAGLDLKSTGWEVCKFGESIGWIDPPKPGLLSVDSVYMYIQDGNSRKRKATSVEDALARIVSEDHGGTTAEKNAMYKVLINKPGKKSRAVKSVKRNPSEDMDPIGSGEGFRTDLYRGMNAAARKHGFYKLIAVDSAISEALRKIVNAAFGKNRKEGDWK